MPSSRLLISVLLNNSMTLHTQQWTSLFGRCKFLFLLLLQGSLRLTIFSSVEANVIIIAACIPTLRPFFHKIFKDTKVTEGRSFFRSGSFFKIGSRSRYAFGSKKSTNKDQSNLSKTEDVYTKDISAIELGHKSKDSDSQLRILRTTEFSMDSNRRGDNWSSGGRSANAV